MRAIPDYQDLFNSYLESKKWQQEPKSLYDPINYILSLGGKRLRPVLTLMSADIFGVDCTKALNAAMAIEVFHNFSLIHDDIMDEAPLRRGKPTVHEKWDLNTGILSGDAMLILASQFLEFYEAETFQQLMVLFNATAIEVCEGQQYDIDFERRTDVTEEEYLQMIAYKTAVLVGAALKMGAIVAKASSKAADAIYQFGLYLGIAFQLQDDYLDAFGDAESFGKQVGGDILEHKKTYLYLKTVEFADGPTLDQFTVLMNNETMDPSKKVDQVKGIYQRTGAEKAILAAVERFTEKAFEVLEEIDIASENRMALKAFGLQLMKRKV